MQTVSQPAFRFKKMALAMSVLVCMLAIGARAQDNGVADLNNGVDAFNQ
ncbi:MAG: hypothetical protein ABI210_04415 [Abditibacteriaceae bacterium]